MRAESPPLHVVGGGPRGGWEEEAAGADAMAVVRASVRA